MKRRRIANTAILLALFVILRYFADQGPAESTVVDLYDRSGEATEDVTEAEKPQTEYEEAIESFDFEGEMAVVLEYGTKEFFCGYPVDEAFLGWVAARYGIGTIESLAGQLERGNTDPDLWYRMTDNTMHVLWTNFCKDRGYSSYLYEDVVWKEAADPSCIRLDFVGDINFDDDWCTMTEADGIKGVENSISQEIQDELQTADITMVNNEFTYTTRGQTQEGKTYSFRAKPENVRLLEIFGTDIVSVANNHVFDYSEQGFLDTLDTLEDAGIVYSGGGRDLSEASAVRYFIVGGRKIAIISATEIERFSHYTKKAGENTPGVLKTQQEKELKAAIKSAGKNSDYVIAYIHWGEEGRIHYGSDQTALAKLCADAGADAVIGGHPHRLQGVEFIGDTPVAYSLGNFWFSTGCLYTTIAQIRIDGDGELTLRMLPCIHRDVKTYLLKEEEEVKAFYQYLADVSSNVGIDEMGNIYSYKDVNQPGESPYAYTSGRKYGQHFDDVDLNLNLIDIVGNLYHSDSGK